MQVGCFLVCIHARKDPESTEMIYAIHLVACGGLKVACLPVLWVYIESVNLRLLSAPEATVTAQ